MINEAILNQILELLNYSSEDIHLLGGYFDHVYEISAAPSIVVKIFDRGIDSEEQILSEIEWTLFLEENGVNVAVPILIRNESYTYSLSDKLFFAAYEKVNGRHIYIDDEEWNDKLFHQWGRGMGKIHSLSELYPTGKYGRPEWHEHPMYQLNMNHFDPMITEKWENYLKGIHFIHKSKDSYGIIHGDLHHHNFLYDNGELAFIDFGDSEYNWFAYDIAIAIYHASQSFNDMDKRSKFALSFFNAFIDGYSMEKSVNETLKNIDFFVDFRHLYSYVYHMQHLDRTNLNERQLQYLDGMRLSIMSEDSYLGIKLV
ncbi:phosphotransferase enzyme family protein [Paenibacillus segetis]|uniref:Aminoglycoside phosphotransferase domain-containing protein n=1 Tax=Paenibacillus segetis TaxID=1325360 RepID=A0ABQ1YJ85_9BACL|nr:phosphotransferase [Paenibacillus segetis]GGH26927.1 hypothetical protein GCM10008013_28050 [Paenibacillus segetis]